MFPVLSWIQIGGGAVAAFALSFLLHTVDVNRIEVSWQKKLDEQKIELEKKCKDAQEITKRGNDDLQNQYNVIAIKLANARRLQPARCVVPVTSKIVSPASGGEHAGQNGVTADALYEYAADCETYREQRLTLEQFIDDTWKALGQ